MKIEHSKIETVINQEALILPARKAELEALARTIQRQLQEMDFSKVIYVCTHNSRRSQLAQVWLAVAANYYKLQKIESFSGGTETTAFNHRMVAALRRYGFDLQALEDTDNPRYLLPDFGKENLLFSKKYDDSYNPQQDFIAVMVCGQADEDCPFVPGAYARVALPYEDPKVSDDTPEEANSYDAKVEEIGREVCYMVRQLV